MKWTITALMLLACNTGSAQSITQPFANQVRKTSDAVLCNVYDGQRSALANTMNRQCRAHARAEFDGLPDKKTLKDCIKPDNVIDDDVRKCMKGL